MAALLLTVLVGNVGLTLTMPAAVPGYDHNPASSLSLVPPMTAMAAIALLLVIRRPQNRIGWLLGVFVICFGISGVIQDALYDQLYAPTLPEGLFVAAYLILNEVTGVAIPSLLALLPLVFPDGHLLSPRWRVMLWLVGAYALVGSASLFDPTVMGDGHRQVANPLGIAGIPDVFSILSASGTFLWAGLMVASLVSLGLRYRRADSVLRHQLKWFFAGVSVLVFGILVASITSTTSAWTTPPPIIASTIAFMALPVSIAVAVFKYRLYDIDVVISRTLVYGALAAFITAVYVGIVVGVGTLVGSGGQPNLVLSIIATAIVAVAFQPARERLQKVANRVVYGMRATPYEVLSEFSERVAETYAADEALPRMARVLAEGTGADRAEVWLRSGGTIRPAAEWPASANGRAPLPVTGQLLPEIPDADRVVPVRHQGELLGVLTVAKRKGESLTPVEEKLLDDLASQAGLVLKNVGLTAELLQRLEELRASRQRLVAAQDEERRRLERNLHDGAQQNLVALKVKLGLAETLAERDPDKAKTLLDELKGDTDETLETLRDLARGIYPPLLADKGLAAAIEAQTRKATLPVIVDADGIGRYPQDVEAAVYFCCLEALQNVQKYAAASQSEIRLEEVDGDLVFEVRDDGKGFDITVQKRGSGTQNMADRMDALGGSIAMDSQLGRGTKVIGRLPIENVASVAATVSH